jgi:hypothetical protein
MFSATFCFLGIAGFIVAALACFSRAKRTGQCVEVDLAALRAASVYLSAGRRAEGGTAATSDQDPTADEKVKWKEMKGMWMQWYARCQEKAIVRQKAMYSWARTLALCAALSLIGVFLEASFGEPISLSGILAGFRRPQPAATIPQPPQSHAHQNTSTPATNRSPQQELHLAGM